MKKRKIFTLAVILAIALTIYPPAGRTQHIYNRKRDEQAQQALPLAEALKNGELFDKQLKNLASLTKKDFETEFLAARFEIDAQSLNVSKWEDVHDLVCGLQRQNTDSGLVPGPTDIKNALDELKRAIEDAKLALKAFKDSIKQNEVTVDPTLATLFDRIGDLGSLKDFAEKLGTANPKLVNTKTLEAIGEVTAILDTLKGVYDTYKAKVDEFNQLNAELAELRIVLKKVALQSLQVDEEHWKNIAAIRGRRETERADILSLISQYKGFVRRLKLVDFDKATTTPPKPDNFCEAVNRAQDQKDPVDFRLSQIISENLKEIVLRAQNMDEDNQEVMKTTKAAIFKLARGASHDELMLALRQTLTALRNASERINAQDIIHEFEESTRNDLNGAADKLLAAVRSGDQREMKIVLRSIIALAQSNNVKNRDMVADIPQAVYAVAALIARGSTPGKLADLRFTQELHAYSIRKSAVRARAYELTVSTGAKRLSLFHKGGIKPTDVAELVFAASNLAITPAILAK